MFRTIKFNFFGRKIKKDGFGKCVCSGLDSTYLILLSELKKKKHYLKLNSKFATGDKDSPSLRIQFSVAENLWFFEKQELNQTSCTHHHHQILCLFRV